MREYSETTDTFFMPMCVTAVFEDGSVYLDYHENGGDVWETNIVDIAPVDVNEYTLSGFGFAKRGFSDWRLTQGCFEIVFDTREYAMDFYVNHLDTGAFSMAFDCNYIHQLQSLFYGHTREPLVLEWKGI